MTTSSETIFARKIEEPPLATNPIPYAMGSEQFPGMAKVVEEMGELQQVVGQILMTGSLDHWHGDRTESLIEEIGDVIASLSYFVEKNMADGAKARLNDRIALKLATYNVWDAEGYYHPEE